MSLFSQVDGTRPGLKHWVWNKGFEFPPSLFVLSCDGVPAGKEKRFYPLLEVATPHERFRALPEAERHLRPEWLDGVADASSENTAVQMMYTTLRQLHKYIHEQDRRFAEAKLQPWAQDKNTAFQIGFQPHFAMRKCPLLYLAKQTESPVTVAEYLYCIHKSRRRNSPFAFGMAHCSGV